MATATQQQSVLSLALPYGLGAFAIGAVSATAAITCSAIAVKVVAVVSTILSVYALLGIILCAVKHADNPQAFQENICTHITTGFGLTAAGWFDRGF